MFETTIRYLGGLISAYELSGEQYPFLIEQAEQLANRLSLAWSKVGALEAQIETKVILRMMFQGNTVPYPSIDFNANTVAIQTGRPCTIDIARTDVDKCSQISRKLGP